MCVRARALRWSDKMEMAGYRGQMDSVPSRAKKTRKEKGRTTVALCEQAEKGKTQMCKNKIVTGALNSLKRS